MQSTRRLALILVLVGGCPAEGSDDESNTSTDETGDTTGTGDGDDTTGTGDGDTTETDTAADTGTDTGGVDELAMTACDAFANATPQMVIAAATASEAATASLVADGSVVYRVMLPEGAPGFVELQIPDWNTTQAFFTTQDIEYTITTMANAQMPGPRVLDQVCPDAGITDQRVFFPHWTPATIEFGAEGPRDILLMIVRES